MNSPKRSPSDSEWNEKETCLMDHEKPHHHPSTSRARESHYDNSDDLAARVRRAKEAAQQQIETLALRDMLAGVRKCEVRTIYGKRTDIVYGEEKGEAAISRAAEASPATPKEPSPKAARKNVDRQTTLELGADLARREEQ